MREGGAGSSRLGISASTLLAEGGSHSTLFTVEKWDLDQVAFVQRHRDFDDVPPGWEPAARHFARLGVLPFETYARENANLITAAGWALALNSNNFISGTTPTLKFDSSHGRIGLGTSATTPTYADTALNAIGALTTHNWELCGVAPSYTGASGGTGATLVWAATFPTGDANNVAIAEFAVDQGTAAALSTAATAPMVSHGTASPGTKTSSQVWNATVTATFT